MFVAPAGIRIRLKDHYLKRRSSFAEPSTLSVWRGAKKSADRRTGNVPAAAIAGDDADARVVPHEGGPVQVSGAVVLIP